MVEPIDRLKSELRMRGFSPLTAKNYSFFVEKFLASANKPVDNLNSDDAKAYLSKMFDTKSKNTIMLAAASLKFFYVEVLKKDFGNIRMPKKENRLPQVLTTEEVKKIIESADNVK